MKSAHLISKLVVSSTLALLFMLATFAFAELALLVRPASGHGWSAVYALGALGTLSLSIRNGRDAFRLARTQRQDAAAYQWLAGDAGLSMISQRLTSARARRP